MIRNQLIPTFRGQDLACHNNRAGAEKTETRANEAKDPRLIKLPADEEPILVII